MIKVDFFDKIQRIAWFDVFKMIYM